jgi:CubicO group peptidase (beta-lactamase class C family)
MNRAAVVFLILTAAALPRMALASPPGRPDSTSIEAKLDAYLSPYVAQKDFGGAVLIADGDNVLVRKAYGMANYALSVPNTPNTRFGIASLTKTFTAAAVIMLQESGRVQLDDRLDKFLPDYPKGNKITLRHLLGHASGVPNPDYDSIFYKRLNPDSLIETFSKKPLDFEPGTSDRYSNAGYVLLARVVEKASGQRFEQFLHDRIFAPLGMSDTGFLDQPRIILNLASAYVPGPAPLGLENAAARDPSTLFGSGCLYSTVDDLYRWAKAVRSDRLFKRTALKYPFGWGRRKQYGHSYIEQSGLIPGFMSHLMVYLDQPRYVVCLSNIESGLFNRLDHDLTNIAFGGDPVQNRSVPRASTVDPQVLAGYVGRYRGPFFRLRVIREDGRLYSNFDESPARSYLVPISADELYMRSNFAIIRATRDSNGRVSELAIQWEGAGEPMKLPRMKETGA